MKDRELMEQAILAIEGRKSVDRDLVLRELRQRIIDIKIDEEFYALPKEARDKLRMAAKGNRNRWDDDLTPKYEKAKQLRATGMKLKHVCASAGITLDQWYRRQRIETNGTDRPERFA